jgi:hypothetical protein
LNLERKYCGKTWEIRIENQTTGGAIRVLVLLRLRVVAADGQVGPGGHGSSRDVV